MFKINFFIVNFLVLAGLLSGKTAGCIYIPFNLEKYIQLIGK